MTVLMAAQAIATCVVLAVLVSLVVRDPRNLPLRAITVAIVGFSQTVVFGSAASLGASLLGLEPLLSRLVQHLGMLVGGYALIAFYLYSALDRDNARRQTTRQAIPLAVAVIMQLVATALVPAGQRDATAMLAFAAPGASAPEPSIALVYLVPNLYMVYAFAIAFAWTRRYARGAEPRLRRGLALTSVGLASLTVGETIFALTIAGQWADIPVPGILFPLGLLTIVPGSVLFMIGLAYPATSMRLAALRIWLQHRRVYRRLGPLWTLLHQRFPEDAFGRVPAGRWRDALSLRGVHRRYYRRVIECRDGLVRASAYLTSPDPDTPLAERLRLSLRAHAAGAPALANPNPLAIPPTDGLDADARELVTLSDALRHPTP
jgi:hypothetical protein